MQCRLILLWCKDGLGSGVERLSQYPEFGRFNPPSDSVTMLSHFINIKIQDYGVLLGSWIRMSFILVTLSLLITPWPSCLFCLTYQWTKFAPGHRHHGCSYTNPKQKINSWINCWACLADQSFTAREHRKQHVYSYLQAEKMEWFNLSLNYRQNLMPIWPRWHYCRCIF